MRISDWSSDVCSSDLRQVAEARIAGIAAIAVRAAPAATGAILDGEQAAALLQILEQIGVADVGFVKMCGEQCANGHDGRESTGNQRGQGSWGWKSGTGSWRAKRCQQG